MMASATAGCRTHSDLDVNYRYFIEYVIRVARERPGIQVLDFGCGRGELVATLRDAGVEAWGAELFYEGAGFDDVRLSEQIASGVVRGIEPDGRVPFEDGFFGLVVSNQVLEHVENLEQVMGELDRILQPDGTQYHHFPSIEVIREGHTGIPLCHRMRPGRVRTLYTLVLRRIGLGSHKADLPVDPRRWTEIKLDWVDRYCFYRPYAELTALFGQRYEIRHREIEYCRFRAQDRRLIGPLMAFAPLRGPIERAFRRLAFMAIELRRPSPRRSPPARPPATRASA